ncbi:hypothetical protein QYM36_014346 [Artemia franciscana]|uniref:Reverse transcriptase domain-containing protein n=1 Tax=Artemia franciscana TaxID=6661 RepID=A0AA88HND3_ARTSF|nr:hypothetical protein QYM36_014346 [Artemia franciscana]
MFRNKLNEEVLSLTQKSHTSVVTADTCAEAMTSILTNAANQAIPRTSPRKTIPKHTPKAWWTKDCQIMWRIKNATRRAYLRKPSPDTYLSKLQAEANLKRTITNAKYNYWNNFANNLSRETSEPRIHRLISKICGKKTSSNPLMYELIHENSHYDNDTDKAKLFASLFSKKLTSKNQNITTQIMTNPIYQPRPGSEYINHPFSIHELNNAIQHIKANATSSYDNIHPIWIKNLSPLYKQELLNCYNHAWATSTFPNIWKCSSLIPILKKNKPKHDPQSYRPIMITPVLGKLMEKMIYHRLLWFVEKNNLIPHTQTGFRKHHSSTDAFIVLTNAINESLSKNNVLTAAFLDFEGAYDNVDHQILLVKLTNLGLPPKLVSFIKSFIENRSFIVCVGEKVENPYALIKLTENDSELAFKIDTGAKANIMPLKDFNKLARKPALLLTADVLTSYTGEQLKVLGTANLKVQYRNQTPQTHTFHVVCTDRASILSRQSSERLQLIKFVLSVNNPAPIRPAIQKLLNEFSDVFEGIGTLSGTCKIYLKEGAIPTIQPPKRVPFALQAKFKEELDRLESLGVIEKVTTPTQWVNSLVLVRKADGSLRICLDPVDLNRAIERLHYPISLFDEVAAKCKGAKKFFKMDA